MPLSILFQDDQLIVVDKPPGLLSVVDAASREPSVPEVLERQGVRALPVHRLDRDVSGALLLARNEEARERLQDLFRERDLRKLYWALASGWLEPESGKLTFPILEEKSGARVSARGKPARTLYRTLERYAPRARTRDAPARVSELELELVTGRRNQIRVHLAHAGHALIGERKYASGRDSLVRLRSRRVALHAARLSFDHPWSGERIEVQAPLPADLLELRERARG